MNFLLCIFAFFYVVKGDEVPCNNEHIEGFLDKTIATVVSQIKEDITLPDKTTKDVVFTDGLLFGLETLKRTGDAEIFCNEDSVTIKAFLGVDVLGGRYKWKKIIHGKLKSGIAFMSSKEFQMFVEVRQDRDPEAKAELISLDITKMDKINFELTGLKYLSWLISQVADPIANKLKGFIANAVQKYVYDVLAEQIHSVRLPID